MNIVALRDSYPEIIIFDTEYTTWEGALERGWSGPGEHREVVQIAAARVNLKHKKIIDRFSVLVRPRINFHLSDYFTCLTGINQQAIDTAGVDFVTAYDAFLIWSEALPCFSYSTPSNLLADGLVFLENIDLYQVDRTISKSKFHNIRPVFTAAGVPTELYNSGKLYQYFGIVLPGHEHNAEHDIQSLTESLFRLY